IRATRSRLLDVALAVVDTLERSAPCRKTADGNSLAPAELSRFLDLEVPPRASGQTTGRRGACGSRAYHGAGEPALGCATHPRRIAEARVRRLAAQRGAAYAARNHHRRHGGRSSKTTSPTLSQSISSSCRLRPSESSTCSWSCCTIAGESCTSTSRTRPLPLGRRSKLSKPFPTIRRHAISSAIETASTVASFGDG